MRESGNKRGWRPVLGRILGFVLIFSLLPCMGALGAALRGAGRISVMWEPLCAEPGFSLGIIGHALGASIAVAALLAIGSLWAWPSAGGSGWLRIIRLHGLVLTAAYLLYPTLGAKIPLIGSLPFWATAAVMIVVTIVLYALPQARLTLREGIFAAAGCTLFFLSPRLEVSAEEFVQLAGRKLDQRDVIIIGFDSVSYNDVKTVVRNFNPSAGSKIVYENATTPMATTNAAWRSIFSGHYPSPRVIPGEVWGHEHGSWLPTELRARGYTATLMQDDATTNIFSKGEDLDIPQRQGWKWMLETFAWRTVFPLSEAGAAWWLKALQAPVNASSRQANQPEFFQEAVLRQTAERARKGSVLMAAHTCFAHAPIQLTIREIVGLKGWWKKSAQEFYGGASYFSPENTTFRELAETRTASLRSLLAHTLQRLEETGVLGRANVFILSDHGSRAAWVSRTGVHHVMLTAFLPTPATSTTFITAPVSLIDLAPTIRQLLRLPDKIDEGEPLPLDTCSQNVRRKTKQLTPSSIAGGATTIMNPRALGFQGNVTYQPDGTYLFSDELKREIHLLIQKENRTVETLRRLLNKEPAEKRAKVSDEQ